MLVHHFDVLNWHTYSWMFAVFTCLHFLCKTLILDNIIQNAKSSVQKRCLYRCKRQRRVPGRETAECVLLYLRPDVPYIRYTEYSQLVYLCLECGYSLSLSVSFRHSNVNLKFIANNVVSREVVEAYNILSIYSNALLLVFLFLHFLVVGSVR